MARINFKVTEVNDLSSDGDKHTRVVMVAKSGNYDGTGPLNKESDFANDGFDSGRLELVVSHKSQAAHFPLARVVTVDVAEVPYPAALSDRDNADLRRGEDGQMYDSSGRVVPNSDRDATYPQRETGDGFGGPNPNPTANQTSNPVQAANYAPNEGRPSASRRSPR